MAVTWYLCISIVGLSKVIKKPVELSCFMMLLYEYTKRSIYAKLCFLYWGASSMLRLWSQVPGDPSGVAPGSSLSGLKSGAVLGPVPSICARVYVLSVLPSSRPPPAPPSSALPPHQILPHPRVPLASPETSSLTLIPCSIIHPSLIHSAHVQVRSTAGPGARRMHGSSFPSTKRPWVRAGM